MSIENQRPPPPPNKNVSGPFPEELWQKILLHCSIPKVISKYILSLENEFFKSKLMNEFGAEIVVPVFEFCTPSIINYVKSFDWLRGRTRMIIADISDLSCFPNERNPFEVTFIADSWEIVYKLFKNRKLFPFSEGHFIQYPGDTYEFNTSLNITTVKDVKDLCFRKKTYLVSGDYSFQVAFSLSQDSFSHLGHIKFMYQIFSYDDLYNENLIEENEYYLALNIEEIIHSILEQKKSSGRSSEGALINYKICDFNVPEKKSFHKLYKVVFLMEQTLRNLTKSGIHFYYIDIKPLPKVSFEQLMFSAVSPKHDNINENYDTFVNPLEKEACINIEKCLCVNTRKFILVERHRLISGVVVDDFSTAPRHSIESSINNVENEFEDVSYDLDSASNTRGYAKEPLQLNTYDLLNMSPDADYNFCNDLSKEFCFSKRSISRNLKFSTIVAKREYLLDEKKIRRENPEVETIDGERGIFSCWRCVWA